MAARSYEISLRTSEIFFNTRREISYLQAAKENASKGAIFICNHNNSDLFTCEDNMLFSRVKISCFRAKSHLVFHWCFFNKETCVFLLGGTVRG